MDSVLKSVKRVLGVDVEDSPFDEELIIHINSALFELYQIGVGDNPTTIDSVENTWHEVFPNIQRLEAIKMFVAHTVRMVWDPPVSTAASSAIQEEIKRLEFRIYCEVNHV